MAKQVRVGTNGQKTTTQTKEEKVGTANLSEYLVKMEAHASEKKEVTKQEAIAFATMALQFAQKQNLDIQPVLLMPVKVWSKQRKKNVPIEEIKTAITGMKALLFAQKPVQPTQAPAQQSNVVSGLVKTTIDFEFDGLTMRIIDPFRGKTGNWLSFWVGVVGDSGKALAMTERTFWRSKRTNNWLLLSMEKPIPNMEKPRIVSRDPKNYSTTLFEALKTNDEVKSFING